MNDLEEAQRLYLQKSLYKQQISNIRIPTDRSTIDAWFREIEEPIILFGETLAECRNRLGVEVAKRGGLEALPRLKASLDRMHARSEKPEKGRDSWWGRREGRENLQDARRELVDYWFSHRSRTTPRYGHHNPAGSMKELELTGANSVGSRPSTSICGVPNGVAVSERGGQVLFISNQLTEFGSIRLESTGHLTSKQDLVLSSGLDGSIRLFDTSTRRLMDFKDAHLDAKVNQCSWHPSMKYFASAGSDAYWKFWDASEDKHPLFEHRGHSPSLGIKSISVDGAGGALVATGGGDGAVRIWDIRIGKCIMTGSEHVQSISCVEFGTSPCMFISGGLDNKIAAWDMRHVDRPLYTLLSHTSPITGLSFGADDQFVSCSLDGVINMWHVCGRLVGSYSVSPNAKLSGLVVESEASVIYTCAFDRTIRQIEYC